MRSHPADLAAALSIVAMAFVGFLTVPAAGQSSSGAPAAAAAADAPAWNPPRTPDGQPDIQGNWSQQGLSILSFGLEDGPSADHQTIGGQTRQLNRPSAVVDPPDGRVPYQPWAAAQRNVVRDNHTNLQRRNQVDPQDRCFLNGATRFFSVGTFQFLQTPGHVVMLSTFAHTFRIIRLDGGPPAGEGIKLWQGDSRGRWEGNTLVVTTTNHNDKTWFDKIGSFHSDQLRVVERFTPDEPENDPLPGHHRRPEGVHEALDDWPDPREGQRRGDDRRGVLGGRHVRQGVFCRAAELRSEGGTRAASSALFRLKAEATRQLSIPTEEKRQLPKA